MGLVYNELGQRQKALDFYNQSLLMERELENRKGQAVTLANMAVVYDDLGQMQEALNLNNQALLIERELGNRMGQASTLTNIGWLYVTLGQTDKALDFYNQALPIEREVGNRNDEAITLANIGAVYGILGQHEKQLDFFNQSLPISHDVGDRDTEATTLKNIGVVYGNLGQRQKALDFFNQALPVFREIGDPTGEANSLLNIGSVLKTWDASGALRNELAALSLANAVNDPDQQGQIDGALMAYFRDQNNPEVAILFGEDAINHFQRIRKNISGLDKELRADFLQSKSATYRDLAELLVQGGRLDEAARVLDLLKTAELSEGVRGIAANVPPNAADLSAFANIDPDIEAALDRQLAAAGELVPAGIELDRLQRLSTPGAADSTMIASLSAKIASGDTPLNTFFTKTLIAKLQADTKTRLSLGSTSLGSMIPSLGPGVVAFYTLVGKKKISIIVASTAGLHQRDISIGQDQLDSSIAQLRKSFLSPSPDTNENLQTISNLLLDPLAPDIAAAAWESPDHIPTLLWSLDGSLRYVPLNALFDPRQKPGHQYLVERARNVIITPESRAHLLDPPASAILSVAAFGLSRSYDGLPALTNVDRELHAIVKTPQSFTAPLSGELLHNDAFTLTALESSLKENFSIVHIASHFVFKPGDSGDSYLLLGGETTGGSGYELTLLKLGTDPALSFMNTRLLTLSACSTAASDTASNGREMDSLGMVMQQRGAAAVLATLWDVNDASTSLLMSDFYRRWAATPGIAKIEALRQAQIAMLRGTHAHTGSTAGRGSKIESTASVTTAYAHPYYWAPFVLIGNFK
jgi:CHAT domain-containing protein/tetratricopeptide (TPR) repeat protein